VGVLKSSKKSSLDGPKFRGVVEEMFRMCDGDELHLFVSIA
jgi:hypothetical protein